MNFQPIITINTVFLPTIVRTYKTESDLPKTILIFPTVPDLWRVRNVVGNPIRCLSYWNGELQYTHVNEELRLTKLYEDDFEEAIEPFKALHPDLMPVRRLRNSSDMTMNRQFAYSVFHGFEPERYEAPRSVRVIRTIARHWLYRPRTDKFPALWNEIGDGHFFNFARTYADYLTSVMDHDAKDYFLRMINEHPEKESLSKGVSESLPGRLREVTLSQALFGQ